VRLIRSVKRMQSLSRELAGTGGKIGLVPTMGFLHEGHRSLIDRARRLSDIVVVSIFVNPTQFGPGEDLAAYPRDERRDTGLIEAAGGDIVFMPRAGEVYPEDFQTYVEVGDLTTTLEGRSRPGHFRGVTTIVAKLFNIIRPHLAVFGLKDYQQAMVIRRLVDDLNYPIRIVLAPTVREADGLAMSSRNSYFTPGQRGEAVCLYRALKEARRLVTAEGVRDTGRIRRAMRRVIGSVCPSAEIDYIAFTDFETLAPLRVVGEDCICSLAVRLHGVRLIDNMKLG